VGAISCRIEEHKGEKKLYVLTLGVLEPYRHLGIGKRLLDKVFDILKRNQGVVGVFLHVHIDNLTAQNFYKKHEFVETEKIENYYTNIPNPHCFVLEKKIL
jgi:ribosomal protein S18 acetylase RimI-like enzyme